MAIDPATGDLVFADNGIDGNDGGNEAWSTDELDRIPAAQIGGPVHSSASPSTPGSSSGTACAVAAC